MKKTMLIVLIVLCAFFLNLYGKDNSKKYHAKSGMFEMISSGGPFSGKTTIYFDDFGDKSLVLFETNVQGTNSKSGIISNEKENKLYMINYKAKTYTVNKLNDETDYDDSEVGYEDPMSDFDFEKEKSNIIGNEVIMGKDCQIYQINDEGTISKMWIWKDFLMKQETTAMGMKISLVVTKFDLNGRISSDKFKIPAGYEKRENNSDQMFINAKRANNGEMSEEEEQQMKKRAQQNKEEEPKDLNEALDQLKNLFGN